ncbi:NAD(P)-dependent dehydrogenase, short-chain alcohol dehydrogenase family [Paraburkholderia fungorum]|uniref:NAD(P)-dependent dehydrogenase, short-chain alcohol dehydrogenase family n=1 Tax=Paraburkholderia fungorum TaxID=134537 RepID=A0A1H1I846_9BURK|nr:oxidoreductase [Paraburkholderia fungorum]SDR33871.1 NAD(P)-dependent dehydrogenase, short-chain alcohol dehydrogenase family [Paraburkholderia fungorum]
MKVTWTPADIPSLNGKRILITGANSGIGYHAALVLAQKGAHVILACRDSRRAETALTRLKTTAPEASAEVSSLDLASLESIREFARRELAEQRPLHMLINNAGVMAPPKRLETADGFELQFGTNVLGHFALTGLLMPLLERAAVSEPPRVVTVASIAHKRGRLDFDDLQSTRRYSPMQSYQQSKLANLMFALELDRRLRANGSRVMSVAVHPGVANTNLFRAGERSALDSAMRAVASHLIGAFLNSDDAGALPTLYAATSPNVAGGGYYGPTGWMEMRGDHVGDAAIAQQAQDVESARRLWDVCETLTGVKFPLQPSEA